MDAQNENVPNATKAIETNFERDKENQSSPDGNSLDNAPLSEFVLERQDAFIGKKQFKMQCFSVYNVLHNDVEGRKILEKKELNKRSRRIVVDLVVRGAMRQSSRLTNECLKILAKKIIAIFTSERLSIYYIEPVKKNNSKNTKSIISRGKLPIKYRNLRKHMKAYENQQSEPENHELPVSADAQTSETWLKTNVEPFYEVENHWINSRSIRCNDLQCKKTYNVSNFLAKWPILKQPMGYKLIEMDFIHLIKEEKFTLEINQWETFIRNLRAIRPGNSRSKDFRELSEIIEQQSVDENSRVATSMYLLPHLFPPNIKISKHYKPSIVDAQNSIILRLVTDEEKVKVVKDKAKKLKKLGQSLQPFIIVIGKWWTSITDCYVSVNRVLYKVSSVLEGIKICFQTFHVLDAKYPAESHHIWCLIQEVLFRMPPEADSSISEFITELEIKKSKETGTGSDYQEKSVDPDKITSEETAGLMEVEKHFFDEQRELMEVSHSLNGEHGESTFSPAIVVFNPENYITERSGIFDDVDEIIKTDFTKEF